MARRAELFVRELSDGEAAHLLHLSKRGPNAVVRHQAMLLFASFQGQSVSQIALLFAASATHVAALIHAFNAEGFPALGPHWGEGRPRRIDADQRAEIVKVALARPTDRGEPFSSWSLAKLRDHLVRIRIVPAISRSQLWRILRDAGIRFQHHKIERVVRHRLGTWTPGPSIKLAVVGWSDLVSMATSAGREGSRAERDLALELATYLRGVADMRDTNTNQVNVVALSRRVWDGWPADLSPVDEVEKYRVYHYPTVGNYRKIVPNYMGFRYDGVLKSIHHVDSYEIIDSPYGHVPGAPDLAWDAPANLLHLGPPIRPDHRVPTGKGIWPSAPMVVDIDLLLTCATITEARDATKARRSA